MRWLKLALDIVIGAVIPIWLLENMTEVWGSVPTYLVAALIPVGYVLIDTFFITRRFNVITSFGAAGALLRGALAFWFVDGALFALKDSAGFVLNLLIFGGSLLIGRPVMRFFLVQALGPDSAEKTQALDDVLGLPTVVKAIVLASVLLAAEAVITGVVNYFLNLGIVVAPFGDGLFVKQGVQVIEFTWIAFTICNFAVFGLGFTLIYRALIAALPEAGPDEKTLRCLS
ncbi:MAG: hypothetical protein IPO29_15830 [Anaerolineae bacterium]|nr:hypothetical protein [Anaerolineae bacterium]